MKQYSVIVGNVGTVYTGIDSMQARKEYNECIDLSNAGNGRMAGESVILMHDNEILAEYAGKNESE